MRTYNPPVKLCFPGSALFVLHVPESPGTVRRSRTPRLSTTLWVCVGVFRYQRSTPAQRYFCITLACTTRVPLIGCIVETIRPVRESLVVQRVRGLELLESWMLSTFGPKNGRAVKNASRRPALAPWALILGGRLR